MCCATNVKLRNLEPVLILIYRKSVGKEPKSKKPAHITELAGKAARKHASPPEVPVVEQDEVDHF